MQVLQEGSKSPVELLMMLGPLLYPLFINSQCDKDCEQNKLQNKLITKIEDTEADFIKGQTVLQITDSENTKLDQNDVAFQPPRIEQMKYKTITQRKDDKVRLTALVQRAEEAMKGTISFDMEKATQLINDVRVFNQDAEKRMKHTNRTIKAVEVYVDDTRQAGERLQAIRAQNLDAAVARYYQL